MIKFKQLHESLAHSAARSMGLHYYGFGRYGRDNMVTHVNQAGRLQPVHKSFHKSKGEPVLLHYTHLEDNIITRGVPGAVQAIDTLHKLIKDRNQIHTQTKIDGCIDGATTVMTERGEITIHEAISAKSVMTHDFSDGLDKMIPIHDYMCENGVKEWIEIHFDNGGTLRCTVDHEIYTKNRGWIEAQELTSEDEFQTNMFFDM